MRINNHKLSAAINQPSPNHSGKIKPRFIVMHYTAGWTAASAIRTFSNIASKVSAQLTIDTDGTIYQHVPFNVKAWHAGPSTHMGYSGLNNHSIGIELVNPGYLKKSGNNYIDAYGSVKSASAVGPVIASKHHIVGSGTYYWPVYKEAQLNALDRVTELLVKEYDIIDIVTHEEIDTRGWKTDPGPAFPMNRYKGMLGGRNEEQDDYKVTASSLNVRSGPSGEFDKIDKLSKGERVTVYQSQGAWKRISQDGWVHGSFLRRV